MEQNADLHAEEQLFSQNNPYINPSTAIYSKIEKPQLHTIFYKS